MDEMHQYLTEQEVSKMTRIALQTLRNNRFHKLGIPYFKIGKSVRYSYSDVIVFMEKRKIQTDA